jgi:hypothetical protein
VEKHKKGELNCVLRFLGKFSKQRLCNRLNTKRKQKIEIEIERERERERDEE